jgi:ParB-like chromosome segregation protein Spo0J
MGIKDLGKRSDVFSIDPELVKIPGLDFPVAVTDPLYDERVALLTPESVAELVASIDASGWVAVFDAVMIEGSPACADGRRRTFATRIVNVNRRARGVTPLTVRVCITKGDADAIATLSLVANAMRMDDPPVTLAHKIARLRDARGWSLDRIAEVLRITPQSVRNTLSLFKLDESVAAKVNAGLLGATAGYALARLPAAEQAKALATIVDSRGNGKVRKADAEVAVANALRSLPAPAAVVDAEFEPGSPGAAPAPVTAKPVAPKRPTPPPSTKHVPPGLRDFKALLRGLEEGTLTEDSLPEDVWRMIRWAAGDLSPTRIAGLSQALRIMGREPN